jgi:hypothetical protein
VLEMARVAMGVENTRDVPDPIIPFDDGDDTEMIFWLVSETQNIQYLRPRLDLLFETQLNARNSWVPEMIEMCRKSHSKKIVDVSMFDDITDEQYIAAFKLGWFKSMRRQYMARVNAEVQGDANGAKSQAKQRKAARKNKRNDDVSTISYQ